MNRRAIGTVPTLRVKIEQLDERGEVYRTFDRFPWVSELDESLRDIWREFNMDATRVTVRRDGVDEVVHSPSDR